MMESHDNLTDKTGWASISIASWATSQGSQLIYPRKLVTIMAWVEPAGSFRHLGQNTSALETLESLIQIGIFTINSHHKPQIMEGAQLEDCFRAKPTNPSQFQPNLTYPEAQLIQERNKTQSWTSSSPRGWEK